ncbi:hypothetical protein NET03_02620 [Thermomicrobium sp. CFH 73360]|uniref:hypothetical protein n=1 Tax=Thermomicrobium sp. CFH 73360 TaxID=2951987 RepID=UPI00207679B6|nr:hypothetical protein [Thermomicrobium sp. CFH 73360]MCM8745420.1 hypothetical protein [Thermomicrobium sp. CFH 73360]
MRRGTLRSFVGGLALGTVLGALAVWLIVPKRQELLPAWRERTNEFVRRARAQGEQVAVALRTQVGSVRQILATRKDEQPEAKREEPEPTSVMTQSEG